MKGGTVILHIETKKGETATLKIYGVLFNPLTPSEPFGNRNKYFRGSFQFNVVTL